jgi:hypothetical protein
MDWPETEPGSTEPETGDKPLEPWHTLNYV